MLVTSSSQEIRKYFIFTMIFYWDYLPLHQSSTELVLCGHTKGVTLVYLYHGDSLDTFQDSQKSSVGDWPKLCLFMYKNIYARGSMPTVVFIQRIYPLWFLQSWTSLQNFLHCLINCSTPKTASYSYPLEKLLWNVKFYLNQYFSHTSSHKIVWRNVK